MFVKLTVVLRIKKSILNFKRILGWHFFPFPEYLVTQGELLSKTVLILSWWSRWGTQWGALGRGQQKDSVGGMPCLTSDVTEVRWPSCGWTFHAYLFLDQNLVKTKNKIYMFLCVYVYIHTHKNIYIPKYNRRNSGIAIQEKERIITNTQFFLVGKLAI